MGKPCLRGSKGDLVGHPVIQEAGLDGSSIVSVSSRALRRFVPGQTANPTLLSSTSLMLRDMEDLSRSCSQEIAESTKVRNKASWGKGKEEAQRKRGQAS